MLLVGLVLLVVGLVGFAPLTQAVVAGSGLPAQQPLMLSPLPSGEIPQTRIDSLPLGGQVGTRIQTAQDVLPLATAALGPTGGRWLINILTDRTAQPFNTTAVGSEGGLGATYPYSYPPLNHVLDAAPDQGRSRASVSLGASLIKLATIPGPSVDGPALYDNAGPLAFGVLSRARTADRCAAELDLLLLLVTDNQPRDDSARQQAATATAACPDNPTPGWVLGQFQSRRALVANLNYDSPGDRAAADRMTRAPQTFADLERQFPGSPDVWAGAGDMHVRAGIELAASQPFTSRNEFQLGLESYRRAGELGDPRSATLGEAQALLGLGQAEQAVGLIRDQLVETPSAGSLIDLLTTAEETAHQFDNSSADAKRLDDLGRSAYPTGSQVFPGPREPLSTGMGTSAPLAVELAPCCGGASADVVDLSFIPSFRADPGVTGSVPDCPDWSWRRDALLNGQASTALNSYPSQFIDARLGFDTGCAVNGTSDLLTIVKREAGASLSTIDAEERSPTEDARQNLWRWAGRLDRATDAIRAWDQDTKRSLALPQLRLGEVEFLQGHFDDAAAAFGVSARRAENGDIITPDGSRARLDRGAALLAAGRRADGIALLRQVDHDTAIQIAYYHQHPNDDTSGIEANESVTSYYARLQLGDAERQDGDYRAAEEDYAAAAERLPLPPSADNATVAAGVLFNNEALVALALRDNVSARADVTRALAIDPNDPVFLLTAAAAADQRHDVQQAADLDTAALANDPGAFPAANDLGVQLARMGQDAAAIRALRRAVGARPDYAWGWFNLGVLYGQQGPLHLLAAQGAIGKALKLDPSLARAKRQLTIDPHVYRTGLDLSQPLPPRWTFATVERRQPVAAAGLLATFLIALGLARGTASSGGSDAVAWLEAIAHRVQRLPPMRRIRHGGWAVAVTVATFAIPVVVRTRVGVTELFAYALGILSLCAIAIGARQLVAYRQGTLVFHRSWASGMIVGVISAIAGAPWAPLPHVRVARRASHVHAVAPLVLATLAAVLILETVWSQVPITRALGVAALTMAASTLLPMKPMDGAMLGKGGAVLGLGLVGAAAAVVLGLL